MRVRIARAARFGMPAGSQVLASLQSLLISVLIARNSTVDEFGLFGVVFAVWAFTVGLIRSATSELYIFHAPMSSRDQRSSAAPLATALILALAFSALTAGVGLVLPGYTVHLVWLAIALPLFVLQDATRILLIALGRAGSALTIDVVCVTLIAAALLFVPATVPPIVLLYGWSILAALAGVAGTIRMRPRFSLTTTREWWRKTKLESTKYSSDYVLTNALMPVAMVVTSAVVGLAGAAALRAAQMVFAPVTILARGLLVAAANGVRHAADAGDMNRVLRISGAFAMFLAAISVVLGLLLLATPVSLLEQLVGSSAAVVKSVVPAASVATAALGVAMGAGLGLRALRAIGRVIVAKAISFPIALSALAAGAILLGAAGAQWGLALGEIVRAIWSWFYLAKRASNGRPS